MIDGLRHRPLLLDRTLARRLEITESRSGADYAETLARERPDAGGAALAVGGGVAVFAGVGSPLTQVFGLGWNGPLAASEVDRLEAFFRDRGAEAAIETCPVADPSVEAELGKRGYRLVEHTNVLAARLGAQDLQGSIPTPSRVVVREAERSELGRLADVVTAGFLEGHPLTAPYEGLILTMYSMSTAVPFIAECDGEIAGGALLVVRDGLGSLTTAAVVPQYRGRGIQQMLLSVRLAAAGHQGADLAMISAAPGTTSHRNAQRAGFSVLYTRSKYTRGWI